MKDAALEEELREVRAAVDGLRMDPHIRTAPDAGALFSRIVFLLAHLAARIDHLEADRPST